MTYRVDDGEAVKRSRNDPFALSRRHCSAALMNANMCNLATWRGVT